jgi:hypothetical protein
MQTIMCSNLFADWSHWTGELLENPMMGTCVSDCNRIPLKENLSDWSLRSVWDKFEIELILRTLSMVSWIWMCIYLEQRRRRRGACRTRVWFKDGNRWHWVHVKCEQWRIEGVHVERGGRCEESQVGWRFSGTTCELEIDASLKVVESSGRQRRVIDLDSE